MPFDTPQQGSTEESQPKKPRRRKASKGTVQIKNSNGRLQLVFTYGGRRRYLSLGFEDSPETRELAQMKARQIRLDMLSNNFDESMAKYKPEAALSVVEPGASDATAEPSLGELWEKFVEYKSHQCSPNTMYYVYKTYTGYLERMPTQELSKAAEIRDFTLKTIPVESCKRFLIRLNACCKWAVQSGMIGENPFEGMAQEIKPPKSQKSDEEANIHPFTSGERDAILEAIQNNTFCNKHSGYKHSFYYGYGSRIE